MGTWTGGGGHRCSQVMGGRGKLKLGAPLVLPRLCWTKQSSTRYVAEDCAQVSITYGEPFFGTSWGLPFPGSGWSWAETICLDVNMLVSSVELMLLNCGVGEDACD